VGGGSKGNERREALSVTFLMLKATSWMPYARLGFSYLEKPAYIKLEPKIDVGTAYTGEETEH
jgi:hypothetical protein